MAELPRETLTDSIAIANVEVDYFESFTIKISRRAQRRWFCSFTCLTVQAVHIKIVPKLDTDSCLNAIMRFISQKGNPTTMISDNGSNFVGAHQEFKKYVAVWNRERIEENLEQKGIR